MKLLQDDSLIRRAAAQDAAAFEQLMLLHQKPVYNICWRMAGNAEDALDLSQEVFLKLWRTLAQYQFDAAFSTWLYRLTQNVCIDFLRKQKRQQQRAARARGDGYNNAYEDACAVPNGIVRFHCRLPSFHKNKKGLHQVSILNT